MRPIDNVTIRGDEFLWRYMSIGRFADVIRRSQLYFPAATQFADEFEGAVATMSPDFPVDPRYEAMEGEERAFYDLKRLTKISCWHRSDYESNMMWKVYGNIGKGVAIRSTYERMEAACRPFRLAPTYGEETVHAGPVTYVDYSRVRLHPIGNVTRFFRKHSAFATEQEFRFAICLTGAVDGGAGGDVPEHGVDVEVDTDALVECIVLGPQLGDADRERIGQCAAAAGLGGRLQRSVLSSRPRYI